MLHINTASRQRNWREAKSKLLSELEARCVLKWRHMMTSKPLRSHSRLSCGRSLDFCRNLFQIQNQLSQVLVILPQNIFPFRCITPTYPLLLFDDWIGRKNKWFSGYGVTRDFSNNRSLDLPRTWPQNLNAPTFYEVSHVETQVSLRTGRKTLVLKNETFDLRTFSPFERTNKNTDIWGLGISLFWRYPIRRKQPRYF